MDKMRIVILEGAEVAKFAAWLASVADYDFLRVGMDEEGVKVKAGNGTWSPGVGAPEKSTDY